MLCDSAKPKTTLGLAERPSLDLAGGHGRHGLKNAPADTPYIPPLPAERTQTPANALYRLSLPP
jgi:hypothetical protein